MKRPLLAVAILPCLLVIGVANAASLGPVTSTALGGFTGSGASGAPTVYASDNFTGPDGTLLSGRSLVIGGTWTTFGAAIWTLSSDHASSTGVVLGRAVTVTAHPDARVALTTTDNGMGGRTSGVVLRSDAAAATFLSTYTQSAGGGRLHLAKRVGGSSTVLLTVTGVPLTTPATYIVAVDGANVTVSYNGVQYVNFTLSAADQTTFASLGGYGMLNDNAGTVRFDNFRVESL